MKKRKRNVIVMNEGDWSHIIFKDHRAGYTIEVEVPPTIPTRVFKKASTIAALIKKYGAIKSIHSRIKRECKELFDINVNITDHSLTFFYKMNLIELDWDRNRIFVYAVEPQRHHPSVLIYTDYCYTREFDTLVEALIALYFTVKPSCSSSAKINKEQIRFMNEIDKAPVEKINIFEYGRLIRKMSKMLKRGRKKMKFIVNLLGINIEVEGEIDKEETDEHLIIKIKNIENAIVKFDRRR